ncbi:MAG TPA: aldo/keto reductase [Candidatus Saccharimonadales bacterium]
MQTYTLNTGKKIPAIGFGTWEIKSEDDAKQAVLTALEAGYRLIDTAKIYGNETGVGAAIRESGIPREELFVTTKLWNDDQGYERTMAACEVSLQKLGLDYLDLYLIHWPATSKRHSAWKAMEELHKNGVIKAAGVSNYTVDHLKDLQSQSDLAPAVNQVEFHPFIYEQQQAVLKYCQEQNILIEAYSPISRLGSNTPTEVTDIAARLKKSPQQVVLRWCVQQGTLPLPRSTNPDHIRSNLEIFDFELTDSDMTALNTISDGERVTWDPAGMG